MLKHHFPKTPSVEAKSRTLVEIYAVTNHLDSTYLPRWRMSLLLVRLNL
jgi:hypothetical protein